MGETTYSCAECGKPVIVTAATVDGGLVRACEHTDSAVVADLRARVVAIGSFGQSQAA